MTTCKVCGSSFEKAEDYYNHLELHLSTLEGLVRRMGLCETDISRIEVRVATLEMSGVKPEDVEKRLQNAEQVLSTGFAQEIEKLSQRLAVLEPKP